MEYIKKEWVKKLPLWVKGSLKDIDHSNAYTNAAIEAYHRVLKDLHLKGRKRLAGRRLDWLIDCLLSHIINHYWCAPALPSRALLRHTHKPTCACASCA